MITDAHPLHGFGDSLSHSQYNVETPEGIKIVAQVNWKWISYTNFFSRKNIKL